jgi:DNA-binding transcriptional regulator PaaX
MPKTHGSLAKIILLTLLAGALTTSPKTSQLLWKELTRLIFGSAKTPRPTKPENVRRLFHRLQASKLISFSESPDGSIRMELTKRGQKRALQYKLEQLEIKKPRHWDKKWRLAIFDIPEKIKGSRDAFRNSLKDLGFLQIQKSVWVHPFPCENEVDFASQLFGVEEFVFLALATINSDRILRDWFSLP